MINQQQLELSLKGSNRRLQAASPEANPNRANWWFSQMRQVAERAMEWEPAPRFQMQPAGFSAESANHE